MSCLFNSLSYFINENSYDIRQKICNYLENNRWAKYLFYLSLEWNGSHYEPI